MGIPKQTVVEDELDDKAERDPGGDAQTQVRALARTGS
jgi:hypothetical protein